MDLDSGEIVDGLLVAFLLLHLWLGWRSGLLWQSARMATIGFGIVLGLVLTPHLRGFLVRYVVSDPTHADLLGFLFVAGGVAVLLRVLATWADVASEQGCQEEARARKRQDRILGSLFGGLKASILLMVLVAVLQSCWPESSLWRQSRLSPPLAYAGQQLLPRGATSHVQGWLRTIHSKKGSEFQTAEASVAR